MRRHYCWRCQEAPTNPCDDEPSGLTGLWVFTCGHCGAHEVRFSFEGEIGYEDADDAKAAADEYRKIIVEAEGADELAARDARIAELERERDALRDLVRQHAIDHVESMTLEGEFICWLCEEYWPVGGPESHGAGCLAAPLSAAPSAKEDEPEWTEVIESWAEDGWENADGE